MKEFIKSYQENFLDLLNSTEVAGKQGNKLDFYRAIESVCKDIERISRKKGKIIFIGNGGSASIASHMAVDFWKNGRIKSMAFNDSSLLTCISNDFGFAEVFAKPIEFFADKNDILFAISSSGKSENIMKAVKAAGLKGCSIVTFSGFDKKNPLRTKGVYNFYVSSREYGPVEVIHQYICHLILDTVKNG